MSTAVVWFRRDLRLDDNPAVAQATADHDLVVPVMVIEPDRLDDAGTERRRAFVTAVHQLDAEIQARGGRLHIRTGAPEEHLPAVVAEFEAEAVYANADVSLRAQTRDKTVTESLNVPLHWHWGNLVQPPGSVLTKAGGLSRVFTPFWRTWARQDLPEHAPIGRGRFADDGGDPLPNLDHQSPWLDDTLLDRWPDLVEAYPNDRDRPGVDGTSRLSTALRLGTVSPAGLARFIGEHTPAREGFVRQLAWRDWYAHLTFAFPEISDRALRSEYDAIHWRTGPDALDDIAAWKAGQTGYPIVDAGMRQLAKTGWMHNRVRMITASFLVKDLLVDWRVGERHFMHLLVDGEPSQNAGNWQWVAGTGADAAPYFRIFNPATQSRKFDPAGEYVRQWVPELAGLDNKAIHAPWEAPPLTLASADVVLGATYPAPIVDHSSARERTLIAYKAALGK